MKKRSAINIRYRQCSCRSKRGRVSRRRIRRGIKRTEFKGKLADELNNITFPGEMEAATSTLRAWGQYVAIDNKIRQLETSGAARQSRRPLHRQ